MTAKTIELPLPAELDGDQLELELASALGHPLADRRNADGSTTRVPKARQNADGSATFPLSVSVATEHDKAGRERRQTLIVHLLEDRPGDEAKVLAIVKAHRGAKP